MDDVIRLPNAAAAPVVQKRGPGRYPKSIAFLWRERYTRNRARTEATTPTFDPERDGRIVITPTAHDQGMHFLRLLRAGCGARACEVLRSVTARRGRTWLSNLNRNIASSASPTF